LPSSVRSGAAPVKSIEMMMAVCRHIRSCWSLNHSEVTVVVRRTRSGAAPSAAAARSMVKALLGGRVDRSPRTEPVKNGPSASQERHRSERIERERRREESGGRRGRRGRREEREER